MSRTAMLPNSAAYDGPINISSSLSTTYDQTTVSRWFRDDGSVIESQRRFGDVEDWIQYSLDLKAPSGNHQMPSQFQTVYMFSYTSGKVSESSVCSKELPLENVETDGDMIELLQSEWSTLIGWRSLWLRLYAFRYVKIRNLGALQDRWPELGIVFDIDDLPPPEDNDYDYSPKPAMCMPPFGLHYLNHVFTHHAHWRYANSNKILRSLPKRHPGAKPIGVNEFCWGILLETRYHYWSFFILLICCILEFLLVSLCITETDILADLKPYIPTIGILIPVVAASLILAGKDYGATDLQDRCGALELVIPNIRFAINSWRNLCSGVGRSSHDVLLGSTQDYMEQYCLKCHLRLPDSQRFKSTTQSHVAALSPVLTFNTSSNAGSSSHGDSSTGQSEAFSTSTPPTQDIRSERLNVDRHQSNPPHRDCGGPSSGQNSDGTSAEYLHIILRDYDFRTKQIPVNIARLKTDYEIFVKLNVLWRMHRGRWRATTRLRKLRLTQYRLYTRDLVQVLYDPANVRSTYPPIGDRTWIYHIDPPEPEPPLHAPVDEAALTHFFEHPDAAIEVSSTSTVFALDCRQRLPKRSKPLARIANHGYPMGCGIEFVECFNWKLFCSCEGFIVFASITIALIYSKFAKTDQTRVQTAFTIASWVFGVGQILTALLAMVAEFVAYWRY